MDRILPIRPRRSYANFWLDGLTLVGLVATLSFTTKSTAKMNEDTSSSSDDDFLEYLLDDDDDNEDDKRLFLLLLGSTSVRGCEMESPAIGRRSSFYVRERLEWERHVTKLLDEGPHAFSRLYRLDYVSSLMRFHCSPRSV